MDESWNFLKEAPENELALVRKACNKCGLQISSSASSEQLVSCILIQYDDLDAGDSYVDFIDAICKKQSINIEDIDIEKKEIMLLEKLLVESIEIMDEERLCGFATSYGFSNYKSVNNLVNEVSVRIRISEVFVKELPIIISVLYGINPMNVLPCDYCINTTISLKEKEIKDRSIVLAAVMITFHRIHCQSTISQSELKQYVEHNIERESASSDELRKTFLSVLISLCKIHNRIDMTNPVISEITMYLGNKCIVIPEYFEGKLNPKDVEKLIKHYMECAFPCDRWSEAGYKDASERVKESCAKGEAVNNIVFFHYLFPHTEPIRNSFFLMPKDELDQKLNELWLLYHGMNPNDCLLDEQKLMTKKFDCAVISNDSNISGGVNSKEIINTDDIVIDLLEQYFEYDEGAEVLNVMVLFLSHLFHGNSITLKAKCNILFNGKEDLIHNRFKSIINRIIEKLENNGEPEEI